ncbi:MAG TPA: hypothetical protein GX708_11325 [Gallicola sp.]|nr:hypothetical protein [Gallicola sp.]
MFCISATVLSLNLFLYHYLGLFVTIISLVVMLTSLTLRFIFFAYDSEEEPEDYLEHEDFKDDNYPV